MDWVFYIILFLGSGALLYIAGEWLVNGLMKLSRFLGWREFVVAFIIMAAAASIPNLFVGVNSALKGIPELSFGDVMGNNIAALTIAVAIAVLFTPKGEIPAQSRTVQASSLFTMVATILPLVLISDGFLSRGDGAILIATFLFYAYWLFIKKERFTRVYDNSEKIVALKIVLADVLKIGLGLLMLILASEGIVRSASFFASGLGVSLTLIGILIVGIGNSLPEVYFAAVSARRGETWMILGNLMGAVVIPATLVLGIIAIIHPIPVVNFSLAAISRFYLALAAIFFFSFTRSGLTIKKHEAWLLLFLFLAFVLSVILTAGY